MECVIVDDDEQSSEVLINYIQKTETTNLVKNFPEAYSAIQFLQKNQVDLLFLDINMPEVSGIDLIKSLTKLPYIIMTTGSRDFALEAFSYNVTDYLIKPIYYDKFIQAIGKVSHQMALSAGHSEDLFAKVNGQIIRIGKSEILYIDSQDDYTRIHTATNKFLVNITLKDIFLQLNKNQFIRVHRSFIVAIDKITKIVGNEIIIHHERVPISQSYREALISKLKII